MHWLRGNSTAGAGYCYPLHWHVHDNKHSVGNADELQGTVNTNSDHFAAGPATL